VLPLAEHATLAASAPDTMSATLADGTPLTVTVPDNVYFDTVSVPAKDAEAFALILATEALTGDQSSVDPVGTAIDGVTVKEEPCGAEQE